MAIAHLTSVRHGYIFKTPLFFHAGYVVETPSSSLLLPVLICLIHESTITRSCMRKLPSPGTIHVRANAWQSRYIGRMKCIANVNSRQKAIALENNDEGAGACRDIFYFNENLLL